MVKCGRESACPKPLLPAWLSGTLGSIVFAPCLTLSGSSSLSCPLCLVLSGTSKCVFALSGHTLVLWLPP